MPNKPRKLIKRKLPVAKNEDVTVEDLEKDLDGDPWAQTGIEQAAIDALLGELESEVLNMSHCSANIDKLVSSKKESQARVLEILDQVQLKSHTFDSSGGRFTATVVRGSRTVIDEIALKKRLGAAVWNRITTNHLDRKKLEAFVASNEIDINDVAASSTDYETSPFVKVTSKTK